MVCFIKMIYEGGRDSFAAEFIDLKFKPNIG